MYFKKPIWTFLYEGSKSRLRRLVGYLFVGHAPTHMIWSKPNAKNKLEVI